MKNRILLMTIIVLLGLYAVTLVYAETILLKSGKTVEAPIIAKTDKYIKVDISGIPITYYFNEIASIDGKEMSAYTPGSEVAPPPQGPVTPKQKEPLSGASNTSEWVAWIGNISAYVEKMGTITTEGMVTYNQLTTQANSASVEQKKQIIAQTNDLISGVVKELNALEPPAEMETYHRKTIQIFTSLQKIGESILKGDKDSVLQYTSMVKTSMIEAAQELKRVYTAHGAPQEYIQSLDAMIAQMNSKQ
jgi:hypothetical protein